METNIVNGKQDVRIAMKSFLHVTH